MAKKEKKANSEEELNTQQTPAQEECTEEPLQEEPVPEASEKIAPEPPAEDFQKKYESEHDSFLRLAAEYDNFRKRTQKEKDASYTNGKADAVSKLLTVYDNLERAVNQPTEDAAYKKGVEMTLTQLVKIFADLGVEIFGEVGETFDPNVHNAVMHTENEELGENVITQVFQKGFKTGEKVIRFAMVQVAN